MPQGDFSVGIVGLGIVAEAHLKAYRGVAGLDVVAGADVDDGRAGDMSRRFGFRPYKSIDRMLESETLDAVCVLTPAASHRAVTERCARAGLHVLCEKPIAVTLEDAEEMVGACGEQGVKFCYGASYRFLPALVRAREIVASGALGEVVLLSETAVGGSGLEGYEALGAVHYPAGLPGGSGMGLVDHGIHLIDAFSWLIDREIRAVLGRGTVSGRAPVTEFMIMEFEGGAVGHLLYNDFSFSTDLPDHGTFSWGDAWDANGYRKGGGWHEHPGCIHVHGTKGALRIMHYANALYVRDGDGIRQIELPNRPAPQHFAVQMESFVDCVRRDTAPPVPGEEGIRALRALLAAYLSNETGEKVDPRSV